MAFPLAAIGAGIGQFAQDYQRQQEQQRQTLMLRMQLADFQRKMDAETRDSQAAAIAFGPPGTAAQQPAKVQGLPQIGGGSQGWPGADLPKSRGRPTEEMVGLINKAAAQYNVDPAILTGLLSVESSFNPTVTSPKGARGLAQLMPGTATELGVKDPLDITQAIPAAAQYLRQGLDAYGGDLNQALMYYHGGPNTQMWGPITRAYPGTVLARAKQFGAAPAPGEPSGTPAAGAGATLPGAAQSVPGPGAGGGGAGTRSQQARPLTAADVTTSFGGPKTQKLADGTLVSEDDYPYPYTGPAAAPPNAPAQGQPLTVPAATPTDYSTPPPAVAPPPGAATPQSTSLTGTGAVQSGGTQVAQAAPYTAPGMPQPPALPKSKEELVKEIYAQYPGVDGRVARKAAIDREKAEQENYKVRLQQYQAQLEAWKLGPGHRREKIEDATTQAERLAQIPSRQGQKDITLENGVTITGIPGDRKSWKTLTGEPLTPELWKMLSEGRIQVPGSYGANRKAEQIEVTNPDTGQRVFSGLAHETSQNKWVSAADGRVIDTANMKLDRQPISMGVTSQNIGNRISMGANEVARAVENMTAMPLGTTLGWFGGAQSAPPRELRAGLARNLANVITPESAQMLAAMGRGVERGLGVLAAAGAATGLVALQESLKGEIPQENDTGFTVLTKYANMRQLVEAANDTIQASPMVADAQKKQMQANADRIIKAVPWTVADVIRLRTKPTDQSVTDFAKKLGLGQEQPGGAEAPAGAPAGAGGAQAGPPPEAIADLKRDPSPTRRFQFDQIFGQGAADQAVGAPQARTPTPPPSGPVFSAPIPPAQ